MSQSLKVLILIRMILGRRELVIEFLFPNLYKLYKFGVDGSSGESFWHSPETERILLEAGMLAEQKAGNGAELTKF